MANLRERTTFMVMSPGGLATPLFVARAPFVTRPAHFSTILTVDDFYRCDCPLMD